jgi:SulP family sulfate permease
MSTALFRLPRLRTDNLRGDIYGGMTAAVVALPLAMAFGVASGAGPIAGVYGAIFVGLFASLFGGTPSQVSGPTGPMTVVMTGILIRYTALDPVTGPTMAFTVVMMGGVFQILFGYFRLGRYINLVPYPVISGFMSGIGVIIILLQMGPLLGHASSGGPLAAVRALPSMVSHIRGTTLVLGCITLLIVYLLPARVNRILPGPLLALVIGTAIPMIFFTQDSVSVLGEVPTGFPIPHFPLIGLKMLPSMIKSALTLAVLGSIDSLLTSLVADSVTRTSHDSDRELMGQGIGNTIAGLFGGLPGAGATMRTVVNIRAGGRTPLSGIIHAFLLLAVILGAARYASHIPHVVLAGILIKVGTDIIDWDFLKRVHLAPRTGVALMFVVLFLTVFVDLITSVAVGMIAASFLLVHRMAQLQLRSIQAITEPDEESPLCEEAMTILKKAKGRILVYHLSGPLSFGAAKDMVKRLTVINGYDVLLLDLSNVPAIDTTTGMAIRDMIRSGQESGKHVMLSGVQPAVRTILQKVGALQLMRKDHEFTARLPALKQAALLIGSE